MLRLIVFNNNKKRDKLIDSNKNNCVQPIISVMIASQLLTISFQLVHHKIEVGAHWKVVRHKCDYISFASS